VTPALRTLDVLLSHGCLDPLQPPASNWALETLALVRRRVQVAKDDAVRVMAAGSGEYSRLRYFGVVPACWCVPPPDISRLCVLFLAALGHSPTRHPPTPPRGHRRRAAAVYLGLLAFAQPARTHAVHALLDLLAYPFPRIRKVTAEKLYVKLLALDDLFPAATFDAALALLTETPWDADLAAVVAPRDKLYGLLGVEVPDVRMGLADEAAMAAAGAAAAGPAGGAGGAGTEDLSSYGTLVREMGY
jgi:hypothetical protein